MRVPWTKLLFWGYLLFLVCADTTVYNPADPDLWHRLAVGEMMVQQHRFPTGEDFSYLADFHQVADHEWGSGLIFYALFESGGGKAIVALKTVTLALTLMLLVWAGTCRNGFNFFYAPFYALILLALLPSFQSTVRCMVFTHIFFALWLYWYQLERKGRCIPLAWYLLSMVVWCNLHGGFAIGLAWLFGAGLLEFLLSAPRSNTWEKWGIRLGACTLVTLVNPFGWHLWVTTFRALIVARPGFNEWGPVRWWPGFDYPGYKLLLLAVIGLLFLEGRRKGWRRLDQRAVFFLLAAMALAFTSVRHTSLFAAVAAAFGPEMFPRELHFPSLRQPLYRLSSAFVWFTLFLIPLYASLMNLPVDSLRLLDDGASCPVGAVGYLDKNQVRGRLLVPFNYGSYALWELRGHMHVSMDGRYDLVYRPATYLRVEDFFRAKGDWPRLLAEPKPDAIVLPIEAAVYPKLKALPEWKEVFVDKTDAVFLPR